MAYKIIDIQGIGEAYAPKLIAIGIKTPEELLEACLTPSARCLLYTSPSPRD